jgi:uncharacterized surface protein with fasciclin (FAS1) repeats
MIGKTSRENQPWHQSIRKAKWSGLTALLLTGIAVLPGSAAPFASSTSTEVSSALALPAAGGSILTAQSQDIVDTAIAHGSLSTMIGLFEELGMAEDLRGYGRFTVFAPTDNAFRAIPDNVFQALASDRDLMARVLAYHVIASTAPLSSDEISGTTPYRTLERGEVEVRSRGSRIYVNQARVIEADIEATNGIIHIIDQVLIPDDVLEQIQ